MRPLTHLHSMHIYKQETPHNQLNAEEVIKVRDCSVNFIYKLRLRTLYADFLEADVFMPVIVALGERDIHHLQLVRLI